MALPQGLTLDATQNQWASQLNPILANPLNSIQVLKNVALKSGTNVINHKLGRQLQGWVLTDIQGVATIYRSAPMNDKTLTLVASANVTCNIGVF